MTRNLPKGSRRVVVLIPTLPIAHSNLKENLPKGSRRLKILIVANIGNDSIATGR